MSLTFLLGFFSGFRTRVYKQFVINGPAFDGGTGYIIKEKAPYKTNREDVTIQSRSDFVRCLVVFQSLQILPRLRD